MTNKKQTQKKVLLVEDDFILALDAEDMILTSGLKVLVAANVNEAFEILQREQIDGAIMDFNLGNQTSEPVLSFLEAQGIPFAVVSGAELKELTASIGHIEHLYRKPVDYKDVAADLSKLM